MDPLSVTLTVVTLATAVKDLVELGQKIHESFAKVSYNHRNAQRVAEDIKEMVEEIRVFCKDHEDALDDMKDFRLALQALLGKFRSFERSILPLLPRTDGRRQDRLIRGWDAWKNNNKIEGSILDLQSDIMKVIRRHMMQSAMRAEVKLETIHQDTARGLTGILQGLEVVRRDISALRVMTPTTNCSYEAHGTTSNEFNCNVIMFAQSSSSSSAPTLRTPDVITEELMTMAYIKLQVNVIVMIVEKMTTLPVSALNSVPPFQFFPMLEEASMSITHLRHHVVRQVTSIRDLLETERIHTISVYKGANALNELSYGLELLGMDDESRLVGEWATVVDRLLVDASGGGQPDLCANLALHLLNQSVRYDSSNRFRRLQAVEEAYTITQNLRNHCGGEAYFQILYSDVLLEYAKLVDNQKSTGMCVEAIQVLEDVLNVQAFTQSNSPERIQNVVHHSSSFVDNLFSSAAPRTAIGDYAFALRRLGIYLSRDGHSKSALDLQLLAIAGYRKMVSIHGHEHKVDLAWALLELVQGRTANCIPGEELVDMIDESIQLFRELADKNPLYYARQFVNVLWEKARTLQELNRDDEAIATWEEVASLAEQIVQDSKLCARALVQLSIRFRHLNRHDAAARTVRLAITTYQEGAEIQAERHLYLAEELQQLRRYKESSEAARTSVALYQSQAMKDPATWTSHVAKGLSYLSHSLAASGEYSEAMAAWKESVIVLDNLLNANPNAISYFFDSYLSVLDIYKSISFSLEDKEECLQVGFTAVQYLRRLSEIDVQKTNKNLRFTLLQAELWYTYNMYRVGRLQDVHQYIDYCLDVWSIKPEAIPESGIILWHAVMMIFKADVLDAQGRTKEALLVTQKVHNVVKLSVSTHQPSFHGTIESMVQEARLRGNLGHSEEAMQVAEESLRLSRNTEIAPPDEHLVWSLHGVAFTALSRQNYTRAAEAAREGCDILARSEGLNIGQDSEHHSFLRPSLFAMLSSAEANLGRRSTAVEYAHRAVDASLEIRDMKLYVSATTAEQSYMETRGNLADILLATGYLVQARQICEERRAYFSKRVKKRLGDYRELAPILRMVGVLCCSEGRHGEGDAAAKELSRIIRTLGSAFPSLQEQVKIRLRRQAKVPILKVLDDMSQKLDCAHQAGVVSLFAI